MKLATTRMVLLSGLLGVCLGAASAVSAATLYASRPLLHRSQKELQTAKYFLQQATHDCGGHRATAIQKIDAALLELNAAVQYADAHPQEDTKLSSGPSK